MKKIILRVLLGLLALVLIGALVLFAIFKNEIRTVTSIEKIDDYGMYYMDYTSDYGLDNLVAQGGVENDDELLEFVIDNALKGLPIEVNIPSFGCSTFQARSAEGDWLFARNYDLDYVPSMVAVTEPEKGYKSVSIANMAILGFNEENQIDSMMDKVMTLATPYILMDGMNEKGLSIGVLLIKDEPTRQEGKDLSLPTTPAMRYVLDNAANVEEAIALFENFNMRASSNADYHFQMADASGDSAIIEYVDGELSVIRKGGETPMALTNFIVSEGNYGFGHGHDRYEVIIDALNQSEGIMSEEDAMAVLEEVSQADYDPILDEGSSTQWSVVYNNTDLTLDVVAGANFEVVHSFSPFE